jgi:hypothetical protein
MRLKFFEIKDKYLFSFDFEDGTHVDADIEKLIGSKVSKDELHTAHIDEEWGCLEFKNDMVDIEPNTLYNFVLKYSKLSA